MPIHFAIDRRQRLVSYVVEGNATTGEARDFFDTVLRHPDYCCGYDFFGDLSGMDAAPEPTYIYAVAAEVNAHTRQLAPCRWAVVVCDTSGLRMVRMWAFLTEQSQVKIHPFQNAEEAAAWLKLPADYSPLENIEAIRFLAT
jgi:hypothetical protein